jgi:hypothetical protein
MAADNHDLPRYPLPAPGVDLAPIATLALIIVLSLVAPVSFLPLGVSLSRKRIGRLRQGVAVESSGASGFGEAAQPVAKPVRAVGDVDPGGYAAIV